MFTWSFNQDQKAVVAKTTESARLLRIEVASPENKVSGLSGGKCQNVAIGKALMTSPKILLMGDPSRGIDIAAKAGIVRIRHDLAVQGLGVLFMTSDFDAVLALVDRTM